MRWPACSDCSDVATDLDLPYHRGDFGQTLGRYGVKPGAFLLYSSSWPADGARRRGPGGRHRDRPRHPWWVAISVRHSGRPGWASPFWTRGLVL
ncbi:MlaA family lipoprotein [Caulobacter segnis]